MPAQRSFFNRADAEDGVPRFLIQSVCLQFDAKAFPDFEGVPQHQVFSFSIYSGALPGWRNPGGTDLDSAVGAVDIHEARTANHASRAALDGCKYHRFAAFLFRQSLIHHMSEIFLRFHAIRNPLKNIVEGVLRSFPEEFRMFLANWFEAHNRAFQSERNSNA